MEFILVSKISTLAFKLLSAYGDWEISKLSSLSFISDISFRYRVEVEKLLLEDEDS